MRVILDTNILLSALLSPSGTPARLLDAWIDRRFILVSHALQLDEIREVSRREKIRTLIRPAEAGRLVNRIAAVAEMPERLPATRCSPDPRDDFLLALSEAAQAEFLATGDKSDLLDLVSHGTTRIVTAKALADLLGL
ncbi:putative toxin-antitoxin system toxin component, PIN family [Sphingomonas quercus]|uniref:Toxin-antitoxin system toxin component, PIN family n=1 Tax=Sphingomonas quercus TaxID=2842451 RepID=A0ABS6BHQ0_9SPHN|nr:putative toxin-antitoxin system toxin component, PIN family [Sphingomonas quercus]